MDYSSCCMSKIWLIDEFFFGIAATLQKLVLEKSKALIFL